jgi:Methyltransferase FkbM domain
MPLGIEVFPFTAAQTTRTVPICWLDDLAPEAQIEPEVLVKLDVQGYEDRVNADGSNTIARARALIVEVGFYPQYEAQALFDGVHQQLRSLGFRYRGSMAQLRHPKDGRVLEADAVFLRD